MKLYYAPGACSLAVHMALREVGVPFDLVKVDLVHHTSETGASYLDISPRGYVPLLELADQSRHTEAAALLQYVADLDPSRAFIGQPGSSERLAVHGDSLTNPVSSAARLAAFNEVFLVLAALCLLALCAAWQLREPARADAPPAKH